MDSGEESVHDRKRAREESDDDERDLSTDEENAAADRKLAEARRRREALAESLRAQKAAAKRARGDDENVAAAPAASGENGIHATVAAHNPAAPMPVEEEVARSQDQLAADGPTKGMPAKSTAKELTGSAGVGWDDEDGYYRPKPGELIENRYLAMGPIGIRGVFASVIKAKDQAHPEQAVVAIKIIRATGMMTKAAEREIHILEMLKKTGPTNKTHIVDYIDDFVYRKHTCLVFECMHDDLRGALKKYTDNNCMTLGAVKGFTCQLLAGLDHMHKHKIIHGDIKPDNILVDEQLKMVKFCDLGSAVETKDVAVNLYLASRHYRPPEAILGLLYGCAADMWSLGCTLYELFTGKVLFKSTSNNDHLKKIMECRGKITRSMVKRAAVYVDFKGNKTSEWKKHFTEQLDFKHVVLDPATKEETTKTITNLKTTTNIKDLIMDRVGPQKRQSTAAPDQKNVKKAGQFADLLEEMLALDPERRLRPEDALGHAFLN